MRVDVSLQMLLINEIYFFCFIYLFVCFVCSSFVFLLFFHFFICYFFIYSFPASVGFRNNSFIMEHDLLRFNFREFSKEKKSNTSRLNVFAKLP